MYFNYINLGFSVTCSAFHYIQCTSISLNQLHELIALTICLLNIAHEDQIKRVQSTRVSEYDPDAHPQKSKEVFTSTLIDYM